MNMDGSGQAESENQESIYVPGKTDGKPVLDMSSQ